jgi:hypothetical protein
MHGWDREIRESWDKVLFSASSQLIFLWEKEKNSLEMSVWQIKHLTTAHEAVVSCVKQTLHKIR